MMPDRPSRKVNFKFLLLAKPALAIMLALASFSCLRPQAEARKTAATSGGSGTAAVQPPPADSPPVAMKSAAKTRLESATRAAVATSLAGFDRHLVARPFDASTAADFELGPLAPASLDAGLKATLSSLAAGFMAATLPYDRFAGKAAQVARLLLAEPLSSAPAIVSVRYSAPLFGPDGVASLGIRVFSQAPADGQAGASDQASRHAARGLVILGRDSQGDWLVEHLEIDLASLELSTVRTLPWDPYATPSSY